MSTIKMSAPIYFSTSTFDKQQLLVVKSTCLHPDAAHFWSIGRPKIERPKLILDN